MENQRMTRRYTFRRIHANTAPTFYCSKCGWSGQWWGSKCPECGK
jgi:predicted RNA-binding Zn-ribbon protein involved in translation (DUF1610 family)